MCHLRFHYDLADEEVDGSYHWADSGLDPTNRRVMAHFVALIGQRKDEVLYGLDAAGACFDPDTGEFISPPLGKGLTCATFVLAVFASYGFQLLQTETWPQRADDADWQHHILEVLREHGASADHVSAAERDIGEAKRFRPEEVAAAVTSPHIPLDFAATEELAREILHSIRNHPRIH